MPSGVADLCGGWLALSGMRSMTDLCHLLDEGTYGVTYFLERLPAWVSFHVIVIESWRL